MTKPNNVIQQKQLTNYAVAVMNDTAKVLNLAKLFAPIVPTGVTNGEYNLFSDLNSFRTYANARRAIGGQAQILQFLSTTDTFAAKPYGLRIAIDEHEKTRAGEQFELLQKGKTRTLTIGCLNSHLKNVIDVAFAAISASAGYGKWSEANSDPIVQLDALIESIWMATGMVPNNLVFDFGAWLKLKNNPNVAKRMPGADLATVSTSRIAALLATPDIRIMVNDVAMYANRTDEAANTKKGALAGSVMLFYSSEQATQYDPSFMKCFSPSENLFTEVYSYAEAPHTEWYENDWTSDVSVVAAALARRISVT